MTGEQILDRIVMLGNRRIDWEMNVNFCVISIDDYVKLIDHRRSLGYTSRHLDLVELKNAYVQVWPNMKQSDNVFDFVESLDDFSRTSKVICECGAAHTSFKDHHMFYCPMNTLKEDEHI